MKVLFVNYAFPPISSPGSMRVYSFAKFLSKQDGYTVDVLYAPNGYSSMRDNDRSWRFERINLIAVKDIFDKNKIDLNGSKVNQIEKSTYKSLKSSMLNIAKGLVFPDRDITWAINVFNKNILIDKYDYIFCSYPNATNLIIGHYYSILFKTPLVVDIRDLWTQDPSFLRKNVLKRFIEGKIEHTILKKSEKIITISEYNAQKLSEIYGDKVEVIYNGFEDEKFESMSSPNLVALKDQENNEIFKIAYAGSFYGGERKVDMLFEAIKSLKDKNIVNDTNFSFNIYGNEEEYITTLIDKYQLSELVSIKGLVSQDTLFKALNSYDLLLVVTRSALISKGEMTTKVFEYIALGNPVLCLSKPDFEIVKVLNSVDHTYCIDIDDKVMIESTLRNIIINHSRGSTKRELNFNFSRDAMSEKLKAFLEK